jgi:hypothetical protein
MTGYWLLITNAYSLQLIAYRLKPTAYSLFKKKAKTFNINATFFSLRSFQRHILASHREFGFG